MIDWLFDVGFKILLVIAGGLFLWGFLYVAWYAIMSSIGFVLLTVGVIAGILVYKKYRRTRPTTQKKDVDSKN